MRRLGLPKLLLLGAVAMLALYMVGGARAETYVVKAAPESVTSSTTLQADDELTFATSSGVAYNFTALLVYASPLGAGAPDLKVAMGEDSTARGTATSRHFATADSAQDSVAVLNSTATWLMGTAATDRVAQITGTYVGGGGTFAVQWAQNTSNGSPTTLRAGSSLHVREVGEALAGGGGGSTAWGDITGKPTFNLSWLEDADTTGAIDGAVLKYDEAATEWQVATDDAGGEGSSGPVTLSAGDRERLDLNWWGVWAIVGLMLCLIIAPSFLAVMRVTRGMGA